ncbi:hypothetical protein [Streptomyces cyaneofuscatus]|uniref:hypothetical protein n=1 Tax=Streptomyces cyaneofuscatus TaxID=66883 RepID=UPI0036966504
MDALQLKLHPEARRLGSTLRIGHLPPNGTEILDAPDFLAELITLLSAPVKRDNAVPHLTDTAGPSGRIPKSFGGWLRRRSCMRVVRCRRR